MKFLLCFILAFSFFISCSGTASQPITKENVRKLLENPPPNQVQLKQGTFYGCEVKPVSIFDFIQYFTTGGRNTGETCSIVVHPNNTVSLNFFEGVVIPLVSFHPVQEDLLIGDLKDTDNNIVVVQHYQSEIVGVTHTFYDKDNGNAFESERMESIKSCVGISSSQKKCGKD